MFSLQRYLGPRIVPERRTATVENRRASLDFRYAVGEPDTYVFTVDIYAYMDAVHPDRHLGWWRFELPRGTGRGTLEMSFNPITASSAQVRIGDECLSSIEEWYNPEYAFDPLGDLQFVVRDPGGEVRKIEPALLKFVDRDVLLEFYDRQYVTEGYSPPVDAPFLHELHKYKLGRLEDLFARHIPGGRVLDVGCGRSLFTEIDAEFPFTVYSGDLNFESVHARAVHFPVQQWAVFDAAAVPFQDDHFDALFAGEVIEHVADVSATLHEWNRVLRPGGVAIITTPNKDRLVARASGMECPYSRDHLSELSYQDLTRRLLPANGFDFVEQSCLYLELWIQNLFNGKRVQDFLQREGNTSKHVKLMRRLFPLGRWVPSLSMGLVVVARKR